MSNFWFRGARGSGLAELFVTQCSGNASRHPSKFQLDSLCLRIWAGIQGTHPLESKVAAVPIPMNLGRYGSVWVIALLLALCS